MGKLTIRDDVLCRTVPTAEIDCEIEIDVSGDETTVTVPPEVTVERAGD
jgi:hypothetical protein